MKFKITNKSIDPIFISGLVLIIGSIIVYFWVISQYIVNIPFGDEYGAALDWISQFNGLESIRDRFLSLFHQANEHRIFTYSAAVLSDYKFFGTLDFKRLLWEGNISILLLFLLLVNLLKFDKKTPITILPIALIIFIPQHEISDWGIVAFGTILQTSIVIGALIFLNKPGNYQIIVAILLAFITTFSFGNGMFVFICGYLILLLNKEKNPTKWLLWSMFMLISISLYFANYVFLGSFTKDIFSHFLDILQYFLVFFGSIFAPLLFGRISLFIVTGSLVLLYLGLLVVCKWNRVKNYPVVLSILLFILLSAGAASITRISFGIGGATAPRYILLQAVFISLIFILTIESFSKHKKLVLSIILPLSIVLYGARLNHNIKRMTIHKKHLEEIVLNYYVDFENIKTFAPPPKTIKNLIDNSKENGIYLPPALQEFYPEIKRINITDTVSSIEKMQMAIDFFKENGSVIQLKGWAFSETDFSADKKIGVFFKSKTDMYVFSTTSISRKDVTSYFSSNFPGLTTNTGFNFIFDNTASGMLKGNYKIGLCIYEKGKVKASTLTRYIVKI